MFDLLMSSTFFWGFVSQVQWAELNTSLSFVSCVLFVGDLKSVVWEQASKQA